MGELFHTKYIIGIDIGTTNIKGSLYSSEGEFISSYSIAYKSYSIKESYHEQDPDDWVDGLIEILKKLISSNNLSDNLEAISLSTQGGTVVPVDKDYNPLTRAFTWLDRRAADLLGTNKELLKKNIEFYNKTGWRLDSNMSFMPLYWLKTNKPDIFKKIHKVLYVNDYVYRKITGNSFQDPSNASISLFYNIIDNEWDSNILDLLDFNKDKFSVVKDSGALIGNLSKKICKIIGIKSKVKVINGGHDQYCAGLGTGIFNDKEILLATGTAWVIFKMLKNPLFDSKRFFAIGRNVMKDKFGLIYSIPSAGISLKWFATSLMGLKNEELLFKMIDKNTNKILKIKNNIIYYPYLTGAFGPDFDIGRKAAFKNFEIGHNYLDFTKAIMEGIGFQLKKIFTVLEEKGIKINKIKMVGGGARSKLWPQIVSDVTGTDVLIPINTDEDFATKGAAILAGYGAGIFPSLDVGYNRLKSEFRVIKPNPENIDFYRDKHRLF